MPKYVLTKKYFDGAVLYNKGKILSFEEGMEPKGSVLYKKPKEDEPDEVSEEERIEAEEKAKAAERAAKSKPTALSQIKPGDTPT